MKMVHIAGIFLALNVCNTYSVKLDALFGSCFFCSQNKYSKSCIKKFEKNIEILEAEYLKSNMTFKNFDKKRTEFLNVLMACIKKSYS